MRSSLFPSGTEGIAGLQPSSPVEGLGGVTTPGTLGNKKRSHHVRSVWLQKRGDGDGV